MAELAQIGVTNENLICLEILKKSGYIEEMQEGARIAAAIALKKQLYLNKDMSNMGSNLNTRWNTSLVDNDNYFRSLIRVLDLNVSDAGVGLRSLIILGLDYIYSRIKDQDFVLLGEIFDEY